MVFRPFYMKEKKWFTGFPFKWMVNLLWIHLLNYKITQTNKTRGKDLKKKLVFDLTLG